MSKEVYGLKIRSERVALFNNILKENPSIEKIFGKEWINKTIVEHYNDKSQIHPIFWVIIQDKYFSEKMIILEKLYNKFKSLINCIKNDTDNLQDILAIISVHYKYKLKHTNVIFQPKVPDTSKECDVKVIIENIEFWGEVLAINLSGEDREHEDVDSYIKAQYNERNKTDNGVYIECNNSLKNEHKDKLLNFVLEEAKKLTLSKGEEVLREFIYGNEILCVVKYFGKGTTYEKGYYGGSMSPVKFMKDDMRIKNKILDKLNKFQFPTTDDTRRFFVLLLKGGIDVIDVDNALFGQECVIFNADGNFSESRNRNGIIHDPERAKKLNMIDFVVIEEDGKRIYRLNQNSPISLDFVKANF